MPIDPLTETVISPPDASRFCPTRRGGKKPHVSCIYRWMKNGCKGVILESLQVGGTRCTSKEALARFFERLTFSDSPAPRQSPARRQRAAEAAVQELRRQGI